MKRVYMILAILAVLATGAWAQQSLTINWAIIQMTDQSGTTNVNGNTNLNILPGGRYEMIHYGGACEDGSWTYDGKVLHLSGLGDYQASMRGSRLYLVGVGSSRGTTWVLEPAHG